MTRAGVLGVDALPGEKAGLGLLGGVTTVVGAIFRSLTGLCLGVVVLILDKGEAAGLTDFSGGETTVTDESTDWRETRAFSWRGDLDGGSFDPFTEGAPLTNLDMFKETLR